MENKEQSRKEIEMTRQQLEDRHLELNFKLEKLDPRSMKAATVRANQKQVERQLDRLHETGTAEVTVESIMGNQGYSFDGVIFYSRVHGREAKLEVWDNEEKEDTVLLLRQGAEVTAYRSVDFKHL